MGKAIAMMRRGASRADAARRCGMDRQTLRDWVLRYNAAGLADLRDNNQKCGRPEPRLSATQQQTLAEIVQ
jgi:transposase